MVEFWTPWTIRRLQGIVSVKDKIMILNISEKANINLTKQPYISQGLLMGILGNMGSGKSWTLGVLAEEAHSIRLGFIFYDLDGDAASLRELGDDVIIVGNSRHRDPVRQAHYSLGEVVKNPADFIGLVLRDGFSMVIDLSGQEEKYKHIAFQHLNQAHYEVAEMLREPVLVIIDEAHQFAPQKWADEYQEGSRQIFKKIVSNGRKRGILLGISTQRSAFLDKDILFGMNIRLFGLTTLAQDYKAIKDYLPEKVGLKDLSALQPGHYYIASNRGYGLIKVKGRRTTHLGITPLSKLTNRQKRKRPSLVQLQLPMVTIQEGLND